MPQYTTGQAAGRLPDDKSNNEHRYPIDSVITINGKYAGFIFAFGSDEDETYLVNFYGGLCLTNRAKLNQPGVKVIPSKEHKEGVLSLKVFDVKPKGPMKMR